MATFWCICRLGGFVKHWDSFDAACFGVSPSDALLMDPQQRVMLEVNPQTFSSLLDFSS